MAMIAQIQHEQSVNLLTLYLRAEKIQKCAMFDAVFYVNTSEIQK